MAAEHPTREIAPAKINLYLHVTGKRDDGYHLLDSLVVFADAADRIDAVSADTVSLDYTGPFAADLPAPESNLVYRAALELAETFGVSDGAHLTLDKQLPVASGIGGGSADAAAAIRALIRLWRLDPDDGRIAKIALGLGADVPVCLMNRAAVMRGIGEDLRLVRGFPDLPVVLVNPGIGVSTPAVFKARTAGFSSDVSWPADAHAADQVIACLADTANDLETPACALAPEIGDVLGELAAEPGARLVRMSGSGATCFAIFDGADAAEAAAERIAARHAGWWAVAAGIYGS